ncbi:aspartate--ammonia ligase [Peptoniphilus sp. KCTC 25270]|uniref:aspartate--ammonia ligase n=1 Tax=Peptoniphilus sp. KCTC 25270 TaxID=2897414 RepID=UPI001E3EA545|nr:aspartate--ammonia ligase [Peptoniphilus sp. KCTC 25270]MCD1147050.1 aspartate--ammonia ligase [Peptoniphilus sp. KCTC 25270]
MRNNSQATKLDIKETQIAIKSLKDFFERDLANTLNLTRVSAPLFVRPETGLNDNLSGTEKAVSFSLRKYGIEVEIVQSLAKWKRYALKTYGFDYYEGLYTDMNAIRPDEEIDDIHSIYVDQWDWEKIIRREDRTIDYLKFIVSEIFSVFKRTESYINSVYPFALSKKLPEQIFFITSQELEDMYPNLSPKERENSICREKKAVFIMGIGSALNSGHPHDDRSPDYDDWDLNGDILFYNPVNDSAIELSSMGIRVDEESLVRQLEIADEKDRMELDYHKSLVNGELPFTVGGGIGQSRICMFFLEKKSLGEVQASVWPEDFLLEAKLKGLNIL